MDRLVTARRAGWILMYAIVLVFAVSNARFFIEGDFSTAL